MTDARAHRESMNRAESSSREGYDARVIQRLLSPTTTDGTIAGDVTVRSARMAHGRRLNLIPLVGVIFFIVCGGAYGVEPLVGAVGPGWAIALIIFTPLFWSLPIALMVAELSSAMPAEGGYYVWVRNALGDFWGVQEGWWAI